LQEHTHDPQGPTVSGHAAHPRQPRQPPQTISRSTQPQQRLPSEAPRVQRSSTPELRLPRTNNRPHLRPIQQEPRVPRMSSLEQAVRQANTRGPPASPDSQHRHRSRE
jgi:hypothetical protein